MTFPGHPARRPFAGWLLALAIFAAAGGGELRAQAEGSRKWGPFSVGGLIHSSPAVSADGKTIYVGVRSKTNTYQGSLIAIDAGSGSTKWQTKPLPDWVESSPAVAPDGTIYVGCWDGKLYAFNASDGAVRWKYDTGVAISFSSPAIGVDGTIYIGGLDSALHAVSPSGARVWRFPVENQVFSSPAIARDGTIYFGSSDNNLYALNPDGTKKWHFATGGEVLSSPAIDADGTIYFGSSDRRLYAITPGGVLKWSYLTGGEVQASPVLGPDGTIYVGSLDRNFYAIMRDGNLRWTGPAGKSIVSTAAVRGDGTVIYGSDDFKLRAVNPADATSKWTFPATDIIESSPVVAPDGTVYVAQYDGSLWAIFGNGSPLSTYSSWPMRGHDAMHSGVSPAPSTGGQLVNLSTRAPAGGGTNLIAGLVVSGGAPKRFLLRGIGPTLADYNVPGAMADSAFELFAGPLKIADNDNWGSAGDGAALKDAFASVAAFPLPAGSKDAALVMSLVPGAYTAVVGSGNGGTGVVLVEAYDAASDVSTTRLINLASRARVTATGAVTPGLVTGGNGSLRVLVRAVGPGLAGFGVGDVLARPTMNFFSGQTLLRSNTGWTSDGFKADLAAAMQAVGAFPLAEGSADCAMMLPLNGNGSNYTIQVSGVGATSGEVLVEVYVVP